MKIADMHCDTIARLYEERREGRAEGLRRNGGHLDLEKMKAGDYLVQNFALFTSLMREKAPYEYCKALLALFYEEMERNKDLVRPVTTFAQIGENQRAGLLSAMLTIEEGGVCLGEIEKLREFYDLGVRMMTLTWNYKNELAHPNEIGKDGKTRPNTVDGLTETGIRFVEEMERMGMMIDVSHLGDAGIYDVFRYTKKPFVASHSNARAVAGHSRNMTDDMIRKLSDRGGVMGINYCAAFLKDGPEGVENKRSAVADMVIHMKYIRNVGGVDCIGLGSDYDGIGSELEMGTAADLPMLVEAMDRSGFSTGEIEKICHQNVLRVYRDILG